MSYYLLVDDRSRRHASRDTTPEKSQLTRSNISSLERSFGSDHDSKEYKYAYSQHYEGSYLDNYKLDRHSPSTRERTRSDQERSSRSVPDGEVSEKLVMNSGKYSRRSYEHSRSERDLLARDMTMRDVYSSDRSKERDRRGHTYDSHKPAAASSLDTRGR